MSAGITSATASEAVLTADGLNDLRIGMSKESALKILGPGWSYADVEETCGYIDQSDANAKLPANASGIGLMVEDGVVTRIDIAAPASNRTESGIGVGSTEADVLAAYREGLESEPNHYDGLPSKFLTYWDQKPGTEFDPKARGIRFLTDGSKVTAIYTGTTSIRYIEGCL